MNLDPCFPRHRYPVRVSGGKYPWHVCAWCGGMWASGREEQHVPQAPPSWGQMSLAQLQVWYARNVMKARI